MSYVFRDGLRNKDDTIEIDRAGLPPNAGKDGVEGTLDGGWGAFKAKDHPYVPVRAEVCSKRCLVLLQLRSQYLPVAGATIQR